MPSTPSDLTGGKYYDFDRDLDVLIRSHTHYFVHVEFSAQHGVVSPAWKFPDSHLFRGGLGGTYPSIGAIEITVENESSGADIDIKKHLMPSLKLPRPNVIKI